MKILKSTVLCLSATALFFGMLAPGRAATIVNVNFNGMTAGQQVAVSTPVAGGGPATAPWSATVPTGSSSNIVADFTATNSPFNSFGNGNVLVIDRTTATAGSLVAFEAHSADKITSGIVSIRFDLMIDNRTSPARSGNLFISVRNGSFNTISSFSIGNNGAFTLSGYSSPGTGNAQSSALGTLTPGTGHTIELRLDYSTGFAQTYIDGSAAGSAQAFATLGGVLGFAVSTSSATVGRWAFDNIVVESIPEPSTGALFSSAALAGLVFMAVRRREKPAA
jgi:hypothetical protein